MKVYELQDYLRGQLRMAEVKIKIGEKLYPITDIKWTGLENGGNIVLNIKDV